jgi:hypothetical protein
MFIESLKLYQCLPFRLINKEDFECDFNNAINLIIGKNGTNKSCTLNLLSLYYSSRSLFDTEGSKSIRLSHNNKVFDITSDFYNSSNPHSFKINNIELNHNGSSQVQHSLFETHLQYTSVLDDLLHFRCRFSLMNKSERRSVFFKLNPINLDYVLQLHKVCNEQLKFYKHNLKSLTLRKGEIEAKFLSQDLLNQYDIKQKSYTDILQNLRLCIVNLDQDLQIISSHIKETDIKFQYDSIIQSINEFSFDSIYKYDILTVKDKLILLQSKYQSDSIFYQEKEKQRSSVYQELQKYTNILTTLQNNKDNITIEDQLEHIESQLQNYIQKSILYTHKQFQYSSSLSIKFTEFIQSKYYQQLKEYLNTANQYPNIKIWNLQTFVKIDSYLTHKIKNQSTIQTTINSLQNQIDLINQQLKKYDIPENCILDNCSLKIQVSSFIQDNLSKKESYNKQIQSLQFQYEYYNKVIDKISYHHSINQSVYQPLLKLLTVITDEYLINISNIIFLFFNTSIIDILKTNPLLLIQYLDSYCNELMIYDKIISLLSQKEQLLTEQSKLKELSHPSISIIQEFIDNKNDIILKLNKDLNILQTSLKNLQVLINKRIQYIDKYNILQSLIKDTQYIFNQYFLQEEYNFFIKLKSIINVYIQEIETKLQQILIIKNEQLSLQDRYNQEIITYITQYTIESSEHSVIEQALSPMVGVPHQILKTFINQIIHNANFFITKVWSYNFHLIPLQDEDNLDFIFSYVVGDYTVSDISKASDAQKTMIDFALTLSFITLKNFKEYPLFLDEIDKSFDEYHKTKLFELLEYILEEKLINQLFIVSHHLQFYSGFNTKSIIQLGDNL